MQNCGGVASGHRGISPRAQRGVCVQAPSLLAHDMQWRGRCWLSRACHASLTSCARNRTGGAGVGDIRRATTARICVRYPRRDGVTTRVGVDHFYSGICLRRIDLLLPSTLSITHWRALPSSGILGRQAFFFRPPLMPPISLGMTFARSFCITCDAGRRASAMALCHDFSSSCLHLSFSADKYHLQKDYIPVLPFLATSLGQLLLWFASWLPRVSTLLPYCRQQYGRTTQFIDELFRSGRSFLDNIAID